MRRWNVCKIIFYTDFALFLISCRENYHALLHYMLMTRYLKLKARNRCWSALRDSRIWWFRRFMQEFSCDVKFTRIIYYFKKCVTAHAYIICSEAVPLVMLKQREILWKLLKEHHFLFSKWFRTEGIVAFSNVWTKKHFIRADIPKSFCINHVEICRRGGRTCIETILLRRQLSWLGHVTGMHGNRLHPVYFTVTYLTAGSRWGSEEAFQGSH